MNRLLLALVAVLSLALSVPAVALGPDIPPSGAEYDRGGNLLMREKHIVMLHLRHEPGDPPFVIPTRCMSACTMYLGLEHACARPEGVFGFHSARTPFGFNLIAHGWNRRMSSHYPPRLREWFRSPEGPGGTRSGRFVMIAAADLIARGEVRACRGGLRRAD